MPGILFANVLGQGLEIKQMLTKMLLLEEYNDNE